jgi:hypothetical protein
MQRDVPICCQVPMNAGALQDLAILAARKTWL